LAPAIWKRAMFEYRLNCSDITCEQNRVSKTIIGAVLIHWRNRPRIPRAIHQALGMRASPHEQRSAAPNHRGVGASMT
jgi:hypothetical protein